MDKIWANRLVDGDKAWSDVPPSRKDGVKAALASRVNSGKPDAITPERYKEITGEDYVGD